jgi:hypothetical protein
VSSSPEPPLIIEKSLSILVPQQLQKEEQTLQTFIVQILEIRMDEKMVKVVIEMEGPLCAESPDTS